MEKIDYEKIKQSDAFLLLAEMKELRKDLLNKLAQCDDQIENMYDSCEHTYQIDYDCSCGYDYLKVCTKCGHSKID